MTNSKELVVLSGFYTKIFTIFVMKLLNQVSKNLKGKLKKILSENSDRFMDIPFIQK